MIRFIVSEKDLYQAGYDLPVDFDFTVVARFREIDNIFFRLGLWNDAEFTILNEFDHVGTIYKQIVVWLIDDVEALIKISYLVD